MIRNLSQQTYSKIHKPRQAIENIEKIAARSFSPERYAHIETQIPNPNDRMYKPIIVFFSKN